MARFDEVAHQRNLVAVVAQRLCAPSIASRPASVRRLFVARLARQSPLPPPSAAAAVAATAPTAIRACWIVSPTTFIADATFTSGKSHTCRSRTFSK